MMVSNGKSHEKLDDFFKHHHFHFGKPPSGTSHTLPKSFEIRCANLSPCMMYIPHSPLACTIRLRRLKLYTKRLADHADFRRKCVSIRRPSATNLQLEWLASNDWT